MSKSKQAPKQASLLRFFGFSVAATVTALMGILLGKGVAAALVMLLLVLIEITFSFENAIINARVLAKMSKLWQDIFLTVGIVIAIFGMRILFPILIVSLTAHLSWHEVIDLVLNHPKEYGMHLQEAHPAIASFGGAFLLMLSMHFFFDDRRDTHWIERIEKHLQKANRHWLPAVISIGFVGLLAVLPWNHHQMQTFESGVLGVITFVAIQGFTHLFERLQKKTAGKSEGTAQLAKPALLTGWAAFSSFIYLEVLDASFSFDGVIGAFAVTSSVLLIAVGLGVGAVWVRSLTVFMVRRGTLDHYKYLEHGAHYTVVVLAMTLLLSVLFEMPELVAGIAGFLFIGSSYWASHKELQLEMKKS